MVPGRTCGRGARSARRLQTRPPDTRTCGHRPRRRLAPPRAPIREPCALLLCPPPAVGSAWAPGPKPRGARGPPPAPNSVLNPGPSLPWPPAVCRTTKGKPAAAPRPENPARAPAGLPSPQPRARRRPPAHRAAPHLRRPRSAEAGTPLAPGPPPPARPFALPGRQLLRRLPPGPRRMSALSLEPRSPAARAVRPAPGPAPASRARPVTPPRRRPRPRRPRPRRRRRIDTSPLTSF